MKVFGVFVGLLSVLVAGCLRNLSREFNIMAGSFDAALDKYEDEPKLSLKESLVVAEQFLMTNKLDFICVGAYSHCRKFGGGWQMWFASREFDSLWIHVGDTRNVLFCEEIGDRFPRLPTLSLNEVLINTSKLDSSVIIGAEWDDESDVWCVYEWDRKNSSYGIKKVMEF